MGFQGWKYLLLITIIFIAACIETDIYLPAFPDMMAYFKVSEDTIQSLLTWNFMGICLSGPFYGPLSDSFGRRGPLLIALGAFLVGSIVTLFASSFGWMLFGRLLQGLGSGGCFTLGAAILFDVYSQDKAVKALNQLNMIIPVIMAFAPMVGGFLNYNYGFRSNFIAIAVVVLLSYFICQLFYKETLPKEKRASFSVKKIAGDFGRCFRSGQFWLMTIICSLIFGGYITFLSVTSVLFVLEFGMKKEIFPIVQSAILGGWVIASLVMEPCMKRLGAERLKLLGVALGAMGSFGLGIVALILPTNAYWITGVMVIFTFGANWMMSAYFTEGMEVLPDIKGTTASLLTSGRLLLSAFVVKLASAFYDGTIYPLVWIILGIQVIILPLIYINKRLSYRASASS